MNAMSAVIGQVTHRIHLEDWFSSLLRAGGHARSREARYGM
jgi:hypothetical protein